MKKFIIVTAVLLSTLSAAQIKVAVAANVSYAIEPLKKAFNERYPDTEVQVVLGSSGKLTAQIKNGAPYDLFMAANMRYPQALRNDAIAVTDPVVYAQGAIAMLSVKKRDFSRGIGIIEQKEIDRIAVANPKTAPYGVAAVEAMKNAGLYERVKGRFIYAESISQTVQYATTAADIGFIAKSSLFSPKMVRFRQGKNWSDVDPKLYTPIKQGIVILKSGEGKAGAEAFYRFILGEQAGRIFKDFGYLVP